MLLMSHVTVVHSLRSTRKLDNFANTDDKECVDIVYPHVAF